MSSHEFVLSPRCRISVTKLTGNSWTFIHLFILVILAYYGFQPFWKWPFNGHFYFLFFFFICSTLEMWRIGRDWWYWVACALTRPLDLIFSMNGDMPHVPITTLAGIASLTDCKCNYIPLKLFITVLTLLFRPRCGLGILNLFITIFNFFVSPVWNDLLKLNGGSASWQLQWLCV